MNKTHRRFNPLPLIIVPAAILTAVVFILVLYSFTQFRVHTNLADNEKEDLASFARNYRISDYIERYGERGPLDIDYQIETRKFVSLDELDYAVTGITAADNAEIDAILGITTVPAATPAAEPALSRIEQAVLNGTPKNGWDLKGKDVKIYYINSYSPSTDKNRSDVNSNSQEYYWDWTYSVYEYSDGTYRYVINIQTS